jgi:hypothetical protein
MPPCPYWRADDLWRILVFLPAARSRDLDAELVGRAGFAFADAFGLRGVEGIELPATLALSSFNVSVRRRPPCGDRGDVKK